MIDLEIQLCYDKLCGKNDLSWSEIKEMTNFPHSSTHLRKMAYGYKRLIDSGYCNVVNDDESNNKLIEIRREMTKLSTMKAEFNKNIRN